MIETRTLSSANAGTAANPSPDWSLIHDPLFSAAERWPDRTAIVDGATEVTYGRLAADVLELRQELSARGLLPGDRVAIFLSKSIESIVALYGAWAAGAIAVPINETLKSRQIEHILGHSGSRIVVSSEREMNRIEPQVFEGVDLVDVRRSPHAQPVLRPDRGSGDAPAAILYTSGSTGRPKGIVLSHDNLLAGARIVSSYLELGADDRLLSVLPFSFDYGLNQLLTSVKVGATLVLHRSHLPADICRALVEHEITGCAGVPPMWIQLMSSVSPFRQTRFPHLRYMTNSGGKFPTSVLRQYREAVPHTRIFLMYGLSEAFRSTYLDPREVDHRPDSIGKAIPETEIFVLGPDGRECAPGVPGELVHSGPTVGIGYWNDPQTTARVYRTVLLPGHTAPTRVVFSGDLVQKDAEGFLYFAGRRDHLIKSQGFRISPDEVEELLLASGLVNEAAVCGKPDELSGQVIIAHVVPKADVTGVEAALQAFCRREMPHYMQPRRIAVHDALPRTASGKLDRQQLSSES
jgi:acyl-CoA ligase (AMP-forming) (exosortase A-associated)